MRARHLGMVLALVLAVGSIGLCRRGSSPDDATPVRLAWDQDGPSEIIADDSAVYFAVTGNAETGWKGAIKRCALKGCGASPEKLADARSAGDLVQDRRYVYWSSFELDGSGGADRGTGRIMRVLKRGGAPEIFAQAPVRVGGLACDGSFVYVTWRTHPSGDIQRIPVDGGKPKTIVTGQCFASPIALSRTHMFWGSHCSYDQGGGVWTATLSGGEPKRLAIGARYFPESIVADAEVIHWTNTGPGFQGDSLTSLTLPDGTPKTVVTRQNHSAFHLAADKDEVFWVNGLGWDGVWAARRASGARRAVVKDAKGVGIAVDDTHVYWTDAIAGTVMKAPKK